MNLTRRAFSTMAAAASAGRILGANDRIKVGVIGTGGRGSAHIKGIHAVRDLNVTVAAVCDIWRPNREKAVEAVRQAFGEAPRQTADFRELLGWDGIDAVVIATPDFWHCPILTAAVRAGKDAYVEKPLGVDFSDVKEAYEAVKASDRIVQVGTQYRSEPHLITAAGMIDQGILGRINRVEAAYNVQQERWARPYADVKVADIAWDLFRRPGIPAKPDPRLLRQWQLFRRTTDGIAGLWMSHLVDIFHWFTGNRFPRGAATLGGPYYWKDGRETADIFYTLLDYPTDCVFNWAMSLNNGAGRRHVYYGERGILDVSGIATAQPGGRTCFIGEGSERPDRISEQIDLKPAEVNSHMANFIECIRSRQQPRAPIDAGFSHAVAGIMSSTALDERRVVGFDEQRLEII